jgi:predicted protein tyrosine phosphatase
MSTTHITPLILPTIVNLPEARVLCHDFPAVITAGPSKWEVSDFKHPNHFVRTFDDVRYGLHAPGIHDVEAMLKFADDNDGEILVHCHAGMSRSTATAWGIAIQRGFHPYEAYDRLMENHPEDRMFWPNDAIVEALQQIFGISGLTEYNDEGHFVGDFARSLFY